MLRARDNEGGLCCGVGHVWEVSNNGCFDGTTSEERVKQGIFASAEAGGEGRGGARRSWDSKNGIHDMRLGSCQEYSTSRTVGRPRT